MTHTPTRPKTAGGKARSLYPPCKFGCCGRNLEFQAYLAGHAEGFCEGVEAAAQIAEAEGPVAVRNKFYKMRGQKIRALLEPKSDKPTTEES